ncbi:MAG: ionic transporter y4hA [Hyphomicrobium sp.]|nr:ionic transporter y4hA [Hyphomicrobium sp.]
MTTDDLPAWTIATPLVAAISTLVVYAGPDVATFSFTPTIIALVLVATVVAAVHHAEVVAHRVGEPYGTLVLALAVTVIEVALIVAMMLSAKSGGDVIARDAVFAAIMIILNFVVGLCILAGASRHHEQEFVQFGVSAALAVLSVLAVLTLVLPNYTTSISGPNFSVAQLGFVGVVSLILYGTFLLVQTVRHRDYFLPAAKTEDETCHAEPPSAPTAAVSMGLLIVCLVTVVALAKALAPTVETAVAAAGAPKAVVGILISGLVLAPESLAAYRAARANRLQTSLNLALGSALATIGLTIPVVAALAIGMGLPLSLGIDPKATVLLSLTLIVSVLSLGTGRTTILQGAVHLVLFAVFLFMTVVP